MNARLTTIRYNLARFSCQLGNTKEAMQWLEKVINLAGKRDIRQLALNDPVLKPLRAKIGQI
jgi:hypothetical protein